MAVKDIQDPKKMLLLLDLLLNTLETNQEKKEILNEVFTENMMKDKIKKTANFACHLIVSISKIIKVENEEHRKIFNYTLDLLLQYKSNLQEIQHNPQNEKQCNSNILVYCIFYNDKNLFELLIDYLSKKAESQLDLLLNGTITIDSLSQNTEFIFDIIETVIVNYNIDFIPMLLSIPYLKLKKPQQYYISAFQEHNPDNPNNSKILDAFNEYYKKQEEKAAKKAAKKISKTSTAQQLETSKMQVEISKAEVEISKAEVETSEAEIKISKAEVETSEVQVETSEAQVETSEAEVETSKAKVETSEVQVETKLNLEIPKISSKFETLDEALLRQKDDSEKDKKIEEFFKKQISHGTLDETFFKYISLKELKLLSLQSLNKIIMQNDYQDIMFNIFQSICSIKKSNNNNYTQSDEEDIQMMIEYSKKYFDQIIYIVFDIVNLIQNNSYEIEPMIKTLETEILSRLEKETQLNEAQVSEYKDSIVFENEIKESQDKAVSEYKDYDAETKESQYETQELQTLGEPGQAFGEPGEAEL